MLLTPRRLPLSLLCLLLSACQAPSTINATRRVAPAGAGTAIVAAPAEPSPVLVMTPPAEPPARAGQRLVAVNGTGSLSGTVGWEYVSEAYFGDSAAGFRLLAMPAGHALITLSTLEEALLAQNGSVLSGASDAEGRFVFNGRVPADRGYVVNAVIAGNHRLSGLVLPGQSAVTLDEASTMVTELARWQVATDPVSDGRKSLSDLLPTGLEALLAATRELLGPDDFVPVGGAVPSLVALKTGNGVALRNQYVRAFGARISRVGTGLADRLSDAWAAWLGYRPLALTAMPTPGYALLDATDIVSDHRGNLYLGSNGHLKLFVNQDRGPLWSQPGAMTAGAFYTVAGDPAQAATFEARYAPTEASSAVDANVAPLMAGDFPMPTAQKLLIERAGTSEESHVFFTSRGSHRVMLIPGADFSRYGRQFRAGRLYTLAGTGTGEAWGPIVQADDPATRINEEARAYRLGDGGPATAAPIVYPQGLAKDSRGNLYVADSGYVGVAYTSANADASATVTEPYTNPDAASGLTLHTYHKSIRLIRASDGRIFTLRLTRNGAPYAVSAQDVRVHEDATGNWLYATDPFGHWVFRVRLPGDLAALDAGVPASFEVQPVLGVFDQPGYVAAGAKLPDLTDVGGGVPLSQLRLNTPLSLDFDADGNLMAGDYQRMVLLKAADLGGLAPSAKVYPLCGAFATGYAEGDSRFVAVRPRYLNYDAYRRTVFFPDATRNRVMMLWTGRGAI